MNSISQLEFLRPAGVDGVNPPKFQFRSKIQEEAWSRSSKRPGLGRTGCGNTAHTSRASTVAMSVDDRKSNGLFGSTSA